MSRYIKIGKPSEVKSKSFAQRLEVLLREDRYNNLILSYDFTAPKNVLDEVYNTFRILTNKILLKLDTE